MLSNSVCKDVVQYGALRSISCIVIQQTLEKTPQSSLPNCRTFRMISMFLEYKMHRHLNFPDTSTFQQPIDVICRYPMIIHYPA